MTSGESKVCQILKDSSHLGKNCQHYRSKRKLHGPDAIKIFSALLTPCWTFDQLERLKKVMWRLCRLWLVQISAAWLLHSLLNRVMAFFFSH